MLRGEPGQTITLEAFNEGDAEHKFTLEGQGIDVDLESGDEEEIEVAFPDSGTLLFFCKCNAGRAMRGPWGLPEKLGYEWGYPIRSGHHVEWL